MINQSSISQSVAFLHDLLSVKFQNFNCLNFYHSYDFVFVFYFSFGFINISIWLPSLILIVFPLPCWGIHRTYSVIAMFTSAGTPCSVCSFPWHKCHLLVWYLTSPGGSLLLGKVYWKSSFNSDRHSLLGFLPRNFSWNLVIKVSLWGGYVWMNENYSCERWIMI